MSTTTPARGPGRRMRALLATLVAAAIAAPATAATRRVPSEYPTIQAAINAAAPGDRVLVADGTYTGTDNRDLNFFGKAITVRSENGPAACVIDCRGSEQNPHRGVNFVSGEGPDSVLDGFTITGGDGQGKGGAIRIRGSAPTITDCVLDGNRAEYDGCGIYAEEDSHLTIRRCTLRGARFSDDVDQRGGGISLIGGGATIEDCVIFNNFVWSNGGGIFASGSDVVIHDTTIENNVADDWGGGGGIFATDGSTVEIRRSTIFDNRSESSGVGGGIACVAGSTLDIRDSTISENRGNYFGGCSALYVRTASATVEDCSITGNLVSVAVCVHDDTDVRLIRCTIAGNTGADAGGVHGPATLIDCLLTGNHSESFAIISGPTLVGCTIVGNTTDSPRAVPVTLVNCVWRDNDDRFDGTATVTYSNVEGGHAGVGNIDADPRFVDPEGGDFRLRAGSPCIDAADRTALDPVNVNDLGGGPRLVDAPLTPDTGDGDAPLPDMGAFEHVPRAMHVPGDDAYLSFDDSPWAPDAEEIEYFHLEDLEDGAFDAPGVTASAGVVREPGASTDSVDGDDGVIDGDGTDGHCLREAGPEAPPVTFTFDRDALGDLPTRAGVAWTDGHEDAPLLVEAFAPGGFSAGSFVTRLGDGVHTGSTDADRFVGFEDDRGIAAVLRVTPEFGHWELDHLQYGYAVPCPADFDDSGVVDFGDILAILAAWGPCEECPEDLDDNGIVDVREILIVLRAWGPCPE